MSAPEKFEIDRPVAATSDGIWGSDVVARVLRQIGVRYVALNPGSSFRGLHDSIVNYLGNEKPQMLLCLHEEHAVAVAHGYAKITEEPIAVILHSNVGLMHATMAIYNAWCDRVPMIVVGATGPVDATERRPWIDWLHTSRDQGALVRHYVKWDDQPVSIGAAAESLVRGSLITQTAPRAPVYVCLDVSMQEQRLETEPALPNLGRFRIPEPSAPAPHAIAQAVSMVREAKVPVILAGRVSRRPSDWARRVALAENLGAQVLTDIKVGAAFPTDHELHRGKPSFFLDTSSAKVLKSADLILSLDWVDLAGTLKQAGGLQPSAKIIQVSVDHQLHNGWSMDHQALPPADLHLACEPDIAVHALADALEVGLGQEPTSEATRPALNPPPPDVPLDVGSLAAALGVGLAGECVSFIRLPLGWIGDSWHFRHPLDYLGSDGGAGIGSGPGMLVGASLALRGSDRLPVAVLGDGDYLMSVSAFWTAAHYKVPFIAVVLNNRSFFNDEIHQERVAIERGRPIENKWIGQQISDPDVDLAAMAKAQGLVGLGPVSTPSELIQAVHEALRWAHSGTGVVIDARVLPGYNPSMAAGMTRKADENAVGSP